MRLVCVMLAGCAGRTAVESCEPNVCGCSAGTCEVLQLVPGEFQEVIATFVAEGSYRGVHLFNASSTGPGRVVIEPLNGDVDPNLDLSLTVVVDDDAVSGETVTVTFEGTVDGRREGSAVDSVTVEVQ